MEKWFSDEKYAQKISKYANMIIMLLHGMMMLSFAYYGVATLALVNVGSVLIYIVCIFMIRQQRLMTYVWITYIEITVYMCIATVCLGWDYGFYLYCIGMIVVIFYADYIAIKTHTNRQNGILFSLMLISAYSFCFVWTRIKEPLYVIDEKTANMYLAINSAVVILFLVAYMKLFLQVVLYSEHVLKSIAQHDELTGLHNRYNMLDFLQNIITRKNAEEYFLAIIDIDDFKLINDTYGHNCGDYVLKKLADILKEKCTNYSICRWGGEEFLIAGKIENNMKNQALVFEDLRKTIENTKFQYNVYHLNITITGGISRYQRRFAGTQDWVDAADKKLYEGKRSGKNKIVR